METTHICRECGQLRRHRRNVRCRECEAREQGQCRRDHPELAREQKKRWLARRRQRDPQYEARRKRIKRAKRPDHYLDQFRRRLDWLRGGDVSSSQLRDLYVRAGGLCFYCKGSVRARFTPSDPRGFDHIIPRVRGGTHTIRNMVVCCRHCNEIKSGG